MNEPGQRNVDAEIFADLKWFVGLFKPIWFPFVWLARLAWPLIVLLAKWGWVVLAWVAVQAFAILRWVFEAVVLASTFFVDSVLAALLLLRRALFGPDLALNLFGNVLTLVVSLGLGLYAYNELQFHYARALIDRIVAVDGIEDFCRESDGLDPASCAASGEEGRRSSDQLIWSLFVEAGIIELTDAETPADLSDSLGGNYAARELESFLKSEEVRTLSTIPLVISLTRKMCINRNTRVPEIGFLARSIAWILAGTYANQPGTGSFFGPTPSVVDLMTAPRQKSLSDEAWSQLLEDLRNDAALRQQTDLRLAPSTTIADAEVISFLTRLSQAQYGKANDNDTGDSDLGYRYGPGASDVCTEAKDAATPREAYLRMQAFSEMAFYLLGRISSNPDVRSATTDLTYWTGYEQLGLIAIGIYAVIVIALRWFGSLATARGARLVDGKPGAPSWGPGLWLRQYVERWLLPRAHENDPGRRAYWKDQLADELESGRWPIRLSVATLPAIGFIGTVRGILGSLSNADQIVWANTVSERADAITVLAANLGLAFATTMIALLMGVAISVLSALETRYEQRTLLTLFRKDTFTDAGPL